MTYAYDEGTNVPVAAGLVEFYRPVARVEPGGATLRINNGSFITTKTTGIQDTPAPRMAEQNLAADHGEYLSQAFYGGRLITVEGTVQQRFGVYADVEEAIEDLKTCWVTSTLGSGLTVTLGRQGWGQKRQMACRLADAIVFEQPDQGHIRKPWREFLLPMRAADPRMYNAELERVIDVPATNTATSCANIGNFETPIIADFYGPFDTLNLIDDANGRNMKIAVALPSGEYIRVRTNARTATRSSNNSSWYANMDGRFFNINRGGLSLRAVATGTTSGLTKVRLTYRDAWI